MHEQDDRAGGHDSAAAARADVEAGGEELVDPRATTSVPAPPPVSR